MPLATAGTPTTVRTARNKEILAASEMPVTAGTQATAMTQATALAPATINSKDVTIAWPTTTAGTQAKWIKSNNRTAKTGTPVKWGTLVIEVKPECKEANYSRDTINIWYYTSSRENRNIMDVNTSKTSRISRKSATVGKPATYRQQGRRQHQGQ